MAGVPDLIYKTHHTKDCNKKEKYKKLLSGDIAPGQKANREFLSLDTKIRWDFKLMVKKQKKLEEIRQTKVVKRENNDKSVASYSFKERL